MNGHTNGKSLLILTEINRHKKSFSRKYHIGINVIKSLNNIIPEQALLTIYKSFIIPHLDYADFIYDQANNGSLCQTIESSQYKATFAIIGATKGTPQAKLYKELGLETLKFSRWCRRLCMLKTSGLPLYLSKYNPGGNHSSTTQLKEGGLKHTIVEKMFSNIHFFYMLFQNGINWTYKYAKLIVYCLLIMPHY